MYGTYVWLEAVEVKEWASSDAGTVNWCSSLTPVEEMHVEKEITGMAYQQRGL